MEAYRMRYIVRGMSDNQLIFWKRIYEDNINDEDSVRLTIVKEEIERRETVPLDRYRYTYT